MCNSRLQIARGSLVTKDQTNTNLIWRACIMIKKLNQRAGIGSFPNTRLLSFVFVFVF